MLDISFRARQLKPSATLAMHELVRKRQARGEAVLHMGTGESPFPVHPNVRKSLCENADKKSYLPVQGILPLREQIAKFYKRMFNLDYSAEQIIIGPGSKILLYSALVALEGPLFLPAPSWVSYQHQANLIGKPFHNIETIPESSYRVNPEVLEQIITSNEPNSAQQKILLLNYPCNPTGASYSATQLREIASVAQEHKMVVLSDEIYGLTSFESQKHQSIAVFYPEGTIITGGISKDRSLGGFRVGVMLLPPEESELKRALLSIASETWSCVAAPIQHAAIAAYQTDDQGLMEYIHDCATIHSIITQYVHSRLEKIEVRCPAPQGAFYLFPDWNKNRAALEKIGIRTASDLSERLLRDWNLAALPGIEFGMDSTNLCIRIATVDYDGEFALKKFQEDRKMARKSSKAFIASVAPRIVQACDQFAKFTRTLQDT
ncbi:MAG: pyridoxal phosphate-dependent aminotransferase [Candidatus Heimdallarchaeota archaeon]